MHKEAVGMQSRAWDFLVLGAVSPCQWTEATSLLGKGSGFVQKGFWQ